MLNFDYLTVMFVVVCCSWDRWVLEDQVLKNNEANRTLMAKLHEQAVQ